jgi:hypothetical protein
MMQRADRVVQLVIIKKSQLVVNLSIANAFGIIERRLIQVDRARKVSLGGFGICVLD